MCELCNGTGLLPFEKKGRVIPNAFINCECKPPDDSLLPNTSVHPQDIDYQVSRAFYRQYANFYHWPDPGPAYIEQVQQPARELVKIDKIIHVPTRNKKKSAF